MTERTVNIEDHASSDLLDAVDGALEDGEVTWLARSGRRTAVIAPAVPPPAARITCGCGSQVFYLAGPDITAVCAICGRPTPLGAAAFTIRMPS